MEGRDVSSGHSEGSRNYNESQRIIVVECLKRHVGQWLLVEDIVSMTGVKGRTVRSICSDADGLEFVIDPGDYGYRVVTTKEEADHGTRRLRSQALLMLKRANRREKYFNP